MRIQFSQRALLLLSLAAATMSCSKEPVAQTPLVVPQAQNPSQPAMTTTTATGTIDAAGIAASYEAHFNDERLERIVETRSGAGSAEYSFKGARLLHYSGPALHDARAVDLRMDVNGRVLSATAGADPMSQEQISEITSRAQLLRSHALAQAAVSGHQ
jgi:hypothetical protein